MRFDVNGKVVLTTWAELALLDDDTRRDWILANPESYKKMAQEEVSKRHYPGGRQ
jgi:hypothetical protein